MTPPQSPAFAAREVLVRLHAQMKSIQPEDCSFERFYPTKLDLIPALLKWDVERQPLAKAPRGTDDIHGYADHQTRTITLASEDLYGQPLAREVVRFTFAHELGHAVLHDDKGGQHERPRSYRRPAPGAGKRRSPAEVEANRFATELLMPERAVRRLFQRYFDRKAISVFSDVARAIAERLSRSIKDSSDLARVVAVYEVGGSSMATFFGVSREAMAVRLMELQLIN